MIRALKTVYITEANRYETSRSVVVELPFSAVETWVLALSLLLYGMVEGVELKTRDKSFTLLLCVLPHVEHSRRTKHNKHKPAPSSHITSQVTWQSQGATARLLPMELEALLHFSLLFASRSLSVDHLDLEMKSSNKMDTSDGVRLDFVLKVAPNS